MSHLPLTLIAVTGLPGSGKSTVASAMARELHVCLLEIDRIEAPLLRRVKGDALEWATYEGLTALAEQQLGNGLTVILDAVSWKNRLRAEWADLASRMRARYRPIEVVCSDVDRYKERVEQRRHADPWKPTWGVVQRAREKHWEDWDRERFVADTTLPLSDLMRTVLSYVRAAPPRAVTNIGP